MHRSCGRSIPMRQLSDENRSDCVRYHPKEEISTWEHLECSVLTTYSILNPAINQCFVLLPCENGVSQSSTRTALFCFRVGSEDTRRRLKLSYKPSLVFDFRSVVFSSSTQSCLSYAMSTPSESVFQPTEIILPKRWRMPLEVCEKVINDLPGYWEDHKDLWACALVCRAWVPRSRICLYRKVTLRTAKTASRFTTTICSSSAKCSSSTLGQLVYTLRVCPSDGDQEFNGWICKAFQALPQLLTNLYELQYEDLPVLHPSFHLWSPKFTTVKSLSILCFHHHQKQTFREIVQIVNAFKNLEKLDIFAKQKTLGLCYWKQSCKLRSLCADSDDSNSSQEISSWLLKDNTSQLKLLKKFSLAINLDILENWKTILENYTQSLQSLQLKFWDFSTDTKCK